MPPMNPALGGIVASRGRRVTRGRDGNKRPRRAFRSKSRRRRAWFPSRWTAPSTKRCCSCERGAASSDLSLAYIAKAVLDGSIRFDDYRGTTA